METKYIYILTKELDNEQEGRSSFILGLSDSLELAKENALKYTETVEHETYNKDFRINQDQRSYELFCKEYQDISIHIRKYKLNYFNINDLNKSAFKIQTENLSYSDSFN
jgi:hypothetical protein